MPPRLALTCCVRGEPALLAAFLAYHRALGVTGGYLFLDRCGAVERRLVEGTPGFAAIPRDWNGGTTHLELHQLACMDEALGRARRDGFDWLLHLDVDEFAWGGPEAPDGSLVDLLAGVAPEVDAVVLRTLEVVPTTADLGKPFWEQRLAQDGGVVERDLLDPASGEVQRLRKWLGHSLGKSAVRTDRDVQAASSHRWTRRQGRRPPAPLPLREEQRGSHLHFVAAGPGHWLRKYRALREEPDRWWTGAPVPFPKQAWKEAAARMDEAEAADYFARWVAVAPAALAPWRERGVVREVTWVRDVLAGIGFAGA